MSGDDYSVDRCVNKLMMQMHDLHLLMPQMRSEREYVKTIIMLHDQYLHDEYISRMRKNLKYVRSPE